MLAFMVVAEMGPIVATALQAASLAARGTLTTGGRALTGADTKCLYSEYDIAILKGFSGAVLLSRLQPIWALFQEIKNMETYCYNIQKNNACLGCQTEHLHKKGLFFNTTTVDYIINLQLTLTVELYILNLCGKAEWF